MEEIIKINYESEQPTVSARELHEGLEIKTAFKDWFPRMTAYGFEENQDFILVAQKRATNNPKNPITTCNDYQISIDMAKQICMIQRTDKGKQYRHYFIDLEKAWNTPEQVMARALKIANNEIEKLKTDNRVLIADTERMKPKEIFADAVSSSKDSCLIGDLAKIICQNGHKIGQKRLFEWMRTNGYLIKGGSSKNMPTQKAMELKLFEVKETTITNPDGSIRITKTTKVTGKGQVYFVNKFAEVEG
jgi:anti-repressor protein|nr:MAG TPA: KilAC domain protein [Caudoviricetes sp.]